jgi:hypothetical protein
MNMDTRKNIPTAEFQSLVQREHQQQVQPHQRLTMGLVQTPTQHQQHSRKPLTNCKP